jgi:hypothetical protein
MADPHTEFSDVMAKSRWPRILPGVYQATPTSDEYPLHGGFSW